MPIRKKDQNLNLESAEVGKDLAVSESITSDLENHQEQKRKNSRIFAAAGAIGLLCGLGGGILGAMFIVPWYQAHILRQVPNSSEGETGKKVILDEESAIIDAVEKVNPAVVSIVVTKDLPKLEQFSSPLGPFFLEAPNGETEPQKVGAGTGFIVSGDGLVITNKHVVADSQAEYTVVTKDNQKIPAEIVAIDPFNDLAVVKIKSQGPLPTVSLGDSDKLKLGQRVIAIGNALGELQNTVTTGVVSGIGRNIMAGDISQTEKLSEVIQTDAAINPGNSGGPLLNLSGEVIGVNTAVSQAAQLIGFAIPINQVKKVIEDVKQFGKIRRPFMGVRYMIITESLQKQKNLPVDYGALIIRGDTPQEEAVLPGSPADQAGLKENDIILELDGVKITVEKQLADLLRNYNPGDRVILKVLSGGEEKTTPLTLGEAQ
jgi:S1-C subfamily serine protease